MRCAATIDQCVAGCITAAFIAGLSTGCSTTAPSATATTPPPPPTAAPPSRTPAAPPPTSAAATAQPGAGVDADTDAGVDADTDAAEGTPATAEARIDITIEAPYKYGQRAQPKTKAAYLADIRERRRWNDGGVGTLLAELPGPTGHPDPRVIVNIDKVRGGHSARALQVPARRYHWMKVVRCYRLGAYKDQTLKGWTEARMEITRHGKVKSARLLSTELDDKVVARCMVDKLKLLKLPSANSGTSAWVRMRIAPGDEPQRPPHDVLEAGPGSLSQEAIREGIAKGFPAFEACYRDAFDYAPGLWGRIVIRFHVTRRGKVDEAFHTESRFPDKRMQQCILHAARKLRFAAPRRGHLRFEVPLRFQSSRADVPSALDTEPK